MIVFAVQIVVGVLSVLSFLGGEFSRFPIYAAIYLACDLLGLFTGKLKSLNLPIAFVFCCVSCYFAKSVSLVAISIGYTAMQVFFSAISIVILPIGWIIALLKR